MSTASQSPLPPMFNKVPEVTLYFWIIKVLATTVGETGADLLATNLGLGLTATSWIMAAVFLLALATQVKVCRYYAPLYWITVVLISVVGTLISDNLVDGMGISLVTTSITFAVILAIVFALGTSAGDLLAERLDLGYGNAALVFGGLIAVIVMLYYAFDIDAILAFWLAYILTRPLGASVGDFLAKPDSDGGMGWGTLPTSLVFLWLILGLVIYLTISRADTIPHGGTSRANA